MKNNLCKENVSGKQHILPWCSAAFLFTAVCAAVALRINGIAPFGSHSILLGDLNCEYLPFLTEFWDKFHAGGSLAYSWRTALGGNFIGNFFYYLASPLNLTVLLFKRSQILSVAEALIFLRQALAALFMTRFLLKRKTGFAGAAAAACGVSYAFCGWFAANFTNIIWLDAFVLLPLLISGVERIVDEGRPWVFAAGFLWILFSDFYMAYIAGVFSAVYFLWYAYISIVPQKPDKKKNAEKTPFLRSRFFRSACMLAGTAILCAMALGFMLVPLLALMSHNTENTAMTSAAGFFRHFAAKLANGLSGTLSLSSMETTDAPKVYCGILALAAAPLYFFAKHVPAREKTASAAVLVFFWLSFNVSALDALWHGFRYPNGFPFRQAFAYSLFLLLLVYRTLSAAAEIPKKAWAVSAGGFALVLLFGVIGRAQYGEESGVTPRALWVSLALFALFAAVFFVAGAATKRSAALVCAAVMLLLTGADCCWHFSENLRFYRADAAGTAQTYADLRELTADASASSSPRAELSSACVLNDGAFFGFNGVRQSSSMVSSNTLRFLSRMGMDSNNSNIAGLYPQTPVFYSVFGIGDLYEEKQWSSFSHTSLSTRADENITLKEQTAQFDRYEYEYALPLGFSADKALTAWTPGDLAAVENQNGFYAAAAGQNGDVLIDCKTTGGITVPVEEAVVTETAPHRYDFSLPVNYTDDMLPVAEMTFTAPRDGTVYICAEMDCDTVPNVFCSLEKPREEKYSVRSAGTTYMSSAYDAEKGSPLKFVLYSKPGASGSFSVRAVMTDVQTLQSQYEAIMAGGALEVETFSDTAVTGTARINGNGKILCTSIPWDKGWTVTVDGRQLADTEICRVGGCLIGFDLTPGSHAVEFHYQLPGLRAGIALSVAASAAALILLLIKKKRTAGRGKAESPSSPRGTDIS